MTAHTAPTQTESSLFCCPVCGGVLAPEGSALRCRKGHTYDTAREGYVHLLPASRMHAKLPGDSREMVQARHDFLQTGGYACFARALSELLCMQLDGISTPCVVDAGCGEGYYTAALTRALTEHGFSPRIAAFDISKHAVRVAAKHNAAPEISYAVASSFSMPLPNACADALVNVFSPVAAAEFLRVLKPGGVMLYAVPGPRHLFGMKEILYETPYENPVQDVAYEGFICTQRVAVQEELTVSGPQIAQLFSMTPYYWKTPRAGAQRLAETKTLCTPVHFDFLVYRKG